MGRGVSSGGGQSSLGYLFGGGEAPKPAEKPAPVQKTKPPPSVDKDIPAGIESSKASTRIEGQNCGNFLSDRPSTKVQAAPGGGSSLDYLFSGSKDGK
ncbi:hypothetical protein QOZ80_5BG0439920 [Eleusine coracana subsp. coracana]|nr:hypothetical protein QOZ80_5BG0439920 [Eleusine coracana subsp. coracana]